MDRGARTATQQTGSTPISCESGKSASRCACRSVPKSLRGPTGPLFLRGGTARGGERYIPDQEISFEVTPRNLNFGR